jgi:hypothetical protein
MKSGRATWIVALGVMLGWPCGCATGDPANSNVGFPEAGSGGSEGGIDSSGGSDASGSGSDGSSSSTGSSGASSDSSGSSSGIKSSYDGGFSTDPICVRVLPGDYEQNGLPPTTGLPSGVSAMTDWTQNPAHGGWNGAQQMDDCRYQADPSGFKTWHGKASARLEVQPGDDPLHLGQNTERAECLDFQDATGNPIAETAAASGTQYYATSYYFPTTWAATFYPWSVFETTGSPWPYGTTTDCSANSGDDCNSWSYVLEFFPWGGLAAASTAPGAPQILWLDLGDQKLSFSDGGQIVLGTWVDLVISIDWSSGAVTVWRRNEGQTKFTHVVSATLPATTGNVTEQQGLYRGGAVNGRTDVLWVGPTARGTTFAAVEQAAFSTNIGP